LICVKTLVLHCCSTWWYSMASIAEMPDECCCAGNPRTR
jgi:hypothetical protein